MSAEPSSSSAPLRLLVVRLGAMGDILHALPAVAGLRLAMPNCHIGWAVESHWAPLLRSGSGAMPLIDTVHLVETRAWRREPLNVETAAQIRTLRRELRAARYDVAVDLQGLLKSAAIGRLAGTPTLFGPAAPRERLARHLYRQRVQTHSRHVIDQACELLGAAAGIQVVPSPVTLPVDEAAEGWCSAMLTRLGVPGSFILLAPGAGWGAKKWPVERLTELIKRLRSTHFHVLINAAPGPEAEEADRIAASTGAQAVTSTLPQLIALTRRAALAIGGDTGPTHLAAALGRPVVTLFGPTDPQRNGPNFPGANVVVLRHASSQTDHHRHQRTEVGLANISVDEVEAAVLRLLTQEIRESTHG